MRTTFTALLLLTAAAPASAAKVVFAGGQWAAIDFGLRCEARSAALHAKRETRPFAGFAFAPAGALRGQFYVHLSRSPRPGATIVATIASQPFLLVGKGEWAWSRNPDQTKAIIEAARFGESMRVESRGANGGRIVERYVLAGAATAIDAAAAACAGKTRPR